MYWQYGGATQEQSETCRYSTSVRGWTSNECPHIAKPFDVKSINMHLLPIKQTLEENQDFLDNPLCKETVEMTVEFQNRVGYNPPWIGYFAKENDELVGVGGFKGKPVNGTIEIAYGTFESHQNRGVGTSICRKLVELSLATDPFIRITARTLPENNFSTRILQKNNFILLGTVVDPEDGEVWEWEYKPIIE